jgi:hypothetical protein
MPSPGSELNPGPPATRLTVLVSLSDHLRDLGVGELLAEVGY